MASSLMEEEVEEEEDDDDEDGAEVNEAEGTKGGGGIDIGIGKGGC